MKSISSSNSATDLVGAVLPEVQATRSHEKNRFKKFVQEAFLSGDVLFDGDRPWDIQVKDEGLYKRMVREGDVGFGEAYMDGWWECERLDEMVSRIFKANLQKQFNKTFANVLTALYMWVFNEGRKSKKFEVGRKHYDLGNDLYESMLDKRMIYTCAYWKDAKTLDDAQEAKLDLVCKKLGLKRGMRVLDIGCGWGGFLRFAAENYGVEGVGITISKEQVKLAKERCQNLPIEIRLQDYREVDEKFDRVASLGMFEHVCHKNHRTFMKVAHRCLKEDGLLLLHTMGGDRESIPSASTWAHKYVIPVFEVPSMKQIAVAAEDLFVMEDWHNFGDDYDKTLMTWFENFDRNWDKFKSRYDERFYRMWRFFWLSMAGSFRSRWNQLWQIVFSKGGVPGGYQSVR